MVKAAVGSFLNPPLLGGNPVSLDNIGIDRISIAYPVTDTSTRTHHWDADKIRSRVGRTKSTLSARFQTSNFGLRGLHVTRTDHPGGIRCRIDITPSLLLGQPDNTLLLSDSQVRSLLGHAVLDVYNSVGLEPQASQSDIRITRLDISRNLVVDDPRDVTRFLEGLAEFHPKYARSIQVFRNAAGVTSVKMGRTVRSVTVYDKHLQSKGAVPKGTVRWEARLRHEALEGLGMDRVGVLTITALRHARFRMWMWSGMTHSIVGPQGFVTRLEDAVRANKITIQTATRLAGSLFIDPALLSASTRSRNRRQLRRLGITPLAHNSPTTKTPSNTTLKARYHAGRISRT